MKPPWIPYFLAISSLAAAFSIGLNSSPAAGYVTVIRSSGMRYVFAILRLENSEIVRMWSGRAADSTSRFRPSRCQYYGRQCRFSWSGVAVYTAGSHSEDRLEGFFL